MAKSNSSPTGTPGMSSKPSKKSSQPPKSVGKQTTLFGFFSKSSTPSTQIATPTPKRVESRASFPLTPLPSSEVGDEVSPVRLPVRQEIGEKKTVGGLRTPVTPTVNEKNGMEMEVDDVVGSTGSRKVTTGFSRLLTVETSRCQLQRGFRRRGGTYSEKTYIYSRIQLIIGSKSKRKVVDDDDDSDVYMPDAVPQEEEEDVESLSAEVSSPPASSAGTSPEPVLRKSKSTKLSKFSASTPASSSPPSTNYSTPKPSLGAFGKPLDKGERVKNFTEKNKDRYSWLSDIRDKEGNRSGEENYDPRTLYIPNNAWKTFTAFEKQYWYISTTCGQLI